MAEAPQQDTWKYRRRVVFLTLAYCAAAVTGLALRGNEKLLHVTLAEGLLWLAGAVVLIYVAGPLAEDIMRARAGMAPKPPREGG